MPLRRETVTLWCILLFLATGLPLRSDQYHTIKKGDTLTKIARAHGTTAEALARANQMSLSTPLRIGKRLRVPGTSGSSGSGKTRSAPRPASKPPAPSHPAPDSSERRRHTVRRGDTLWALARRYDTSIERLQAWNGLHAKSVLSPGQTLWIEAAAHESTRSDQPDIANSKADAAEPEAKPKETPQHEAPDERPPASEPQPSRGGGKTVYVEKVRKEAEKPTIQRRRWRNVVLHHSGTSKGSAAVFERYHRQRGMDNGLAYHFVIGNGSYTGDGEIEVGSRWLLQKDGGHLKSSEQNKISIGICFVGNFSQRRPSPRQIAACIELVEFLRKQCGNPRLKLWMHRDINVVGTECPGKLFPSELLYKRLGRGGG